MYSKFGKKITNEQYDERIKFLSIKRIGDYISTKIPILHHCVICHKEYNISPNKISKFKCSCMKRGNSYKESLCVKNIELLDTYINMNIPLSHKCLNCSLIWVSKPKDVIRSKIGCLNCSGKKFDTNFYKQLLPRDIKLVDNQNYIDSTKYLHHRCLTCNNIWRTKPNYILHMSTGCPTCASSKGEKLIIEILNELDIKYVHQYKVVIKDKSYYYDFYIESYKLFIEYDGIQHYESIEYFGGNESYNKILSNDHLKNEWVKNNNYSILRIPYWENNKYQINKILQNYICIL